MLMFCDGLDFPLASSSASTSVYSLYLSVPDDLSVILWRDLDLIQSSPIALAVLACDGLFLLLRYSNNRKPRPAVHLLKRT
jgi:hypothetical protein